MSQQANRPRRRWILWTVGIAIAVLLAGHFALRLYGRHRLADARARFEDRVGPLGAPGIPDRPDGDPAAIVARVAGALELEDAQRSVVGALARKARRDWTPVETDAAQEVIEGNRERLVALDRSAIPATWGNVVEAKLLALMDMTRLVAVQARLDARDERAIGSIEVLGRLGESLRDEPDMHSFMLGLFAEQLQLSVVRDIAATRCPKPEELGRLRTALGDDDLGKAFAVDLALGYSSYVDEVRDMKTAPLWERYWAASVVDLVLADGLDFAVDLADALSSPYSEVPARIETLGRRWSPWSGSAGPMPYFVNFAGRAAMVAALRQQARLALDLQSYALTHNAYPRSMEAIPEAGGPSPLTGLAYEYARTPDGGARLSAPGASEAVERDHLGVDEDDFIWGLAPPPSSFTMN